MAVTSGFFNSISGDRKYNAEQIGNYFEGLVSNGVFENVDNKLIVTAGSGLSVTVGTGRAMINCHWVKNDIDLTLTLDSADVQYVRYDHVIIKLDLNNSARAITIGIKKGTPSASAQFIPTLERGNGIYEICLAAIKIPVGATSISQSNIIDLRGNTNYCGYVTGLIKQVDTSDLFLQYQTALEEYYQTATSALDAIITQKTEAFDEWFATLTSKLRVDTTLRKYQNTVIISESTDEVEIGIPEYAHGDILFVHINGVMLVENDEFTVVNHNRIKLNNSIDENNTVTFIVIKSVIGNTGMVTSFSLPFTIENTVNTRTVTYEEAE